MRTTKLVALSPDQLNVFVSQRRLVALSRDIGLAAWLTRVRDRSVQYTCSKNVSICSAHYIVQYSTYVQYLQYVLDMLQ